MSEKLFIKTSNPVYFKDEEMKDGLFVLLNRIRTELVVARGKMCDIKDAFGWEDRIEVAEHGTTLVIAYMHRIIEEIEKQNEHERREIRKREPLW